MAQDVFQSEIAEGVRFAFGRNWQRFLGVLTEDRIEAAERSLRTMLGVDDLRGKTFADIGCGSGLFSLAAFRLGAKTVLSFDYDPESVACAERLRSKFSFDPQRWHVARGSVLDDAYLDSLGTWDIVYSWGVLHHTGDMWRALGNVAKVVAPHGTLFISIYNDQGRVSRLWRSVKAVHNKSSLGRLATSGMFIPFFVLAGAAKDLAVGRNPFRRYVTDTAGRGMSYFHDWFDWLGGFPFEVAAPEEIFEFYRCRGFTLSRLKTCGGGLGCNEFVFAKENPDQAADDLRNGR